MELVKWIDWYKVEIHVAPGNLPHHCQPCPQSTDLKEVNQQSETCNRTYSYLQFAGFT